MNNLELTPFERFARRGSDWLIAMICFISFACIFLVPPPTGAICFVVALSVGFILTELRRVADGLAALVLAAAPAAVVPTAVRPAARVVVNAKDGV